MPTSRLVPLVLALAAAQCGLLALGPVLPEIAAQFGVSTAAAGQLRALSGASGVVVALALVARSVRTQPGAVLRAGLAALMVGSLLTAAAPSIALLAGAQALVGAGATTIVAGGLAAAASWADPPARARTVSLVALGQPAAWVVGQPLAGFAGSFGWRCPWIAGPALMAMVCLVLLRRRPAERPAGHEGPTPTGAAGLRRWAAGELAAYAAWCGLLVYAAVLFRVRHGISPGAAGLVLGACSLAYLPAGACAGRMTAEAGRVAVPVLAAAAAGLTGALALANGPLPLTAGLFALLVATAAARHVASSVQGIEIASRPLAATGLRAACTQGGYLVGAAAGGLALSAAGPGALCVVAAAGFAASALISGSRRPAPAPGKETGRRLVDPLHQPPSPSRRSPMPMSPITIRPAMQADTAVLRSLAELDARPPLRGPVLLAEARGRPVAAISLDDGAVAADPFRRTAGAVTLLRTQRELVRQQRREGARRHPVVRRLRLA